MRTSDLLAAAALFLTLAAPAEAQTTVEATTSMKPAAQAALKSYMATSAKAFALALDGSQGAAGSGGEISEAIGQALAACEKLAGSECRIVMMNGEPITTRIGEELEKKGLLD